MASESLKAIVLFDVDGTLTKPRNVVIKLTFCKSLTQPIE